MYNKIISLYNQFIQTNDHMLWKCNVQVLNLFIFLPEHDDNFALKFSFLYTNMINRIYIFRLLEDITNFAI